MSDIVEVLLPFDGFYESHSYGIVSDFAEEEAKSLMERIKNGDHPELKSLLDIPDAAQSITLYIEYGRATLDYVNLYVKAFNKLLLDSGYENVQCNISNLISPKFYNYETDKIEVKMSRKDLKAIFDQEFSGDNFSYFKDAVRMKMKSRDGFASFYDDFADKVDSLDGIDHFYEEFDFEKLDSNQLGVILVAFVLDHPELKGELLPIYFLYEEAFEALSGKYESYIYDAAVKYIKSLEPQT